MNEIMYHEWKNKIDAYSRTTERYGKYQSELQSANMRLANLQKEEVQDIEVHELKVKQMKELIKLLEEKKAQAYRDVRFVQESPKYLDSVPYRYVKEVLEKFELLSEEESDLLAEKTALESILIGMPEKPAQVRIQLGGEGYKDWKFSLISYNQLAQYKEFVVSLLNDTEEQLEIASRNKKLLEVSK